MRRLAAVLLTAVVLSGCGPSPANWHQNGYQWSVKVGKAEGGARLVGVSPEAWCATDLSLYPSVNGIPLNGPPASDGAAVNQWVNGCVAGYNAAP